MVRSFRNLIVEDPGFNSENLLFASFSLPAAEYSPEESIDFYHRLVAGTRNLTGVLGASFISRPPLLWDDQNGRFHIEGKPAAAASSECCVGSRVEVGEELHELLGIPLVRGRLFTTDDQQEGNPLVLLVDQAAADRYWPGEDPIGKRLSGWGTEEDPWAEIVGVVGSVTFDGPGVEFPTIYSPGNRAHPFAIRSKYLVLRAAGDPGTLVEGVRSVVRTLDPGQALAGTFTMKEIQARSLARPRFIMTLLTLFAGVALALGAIGIYGVMSYGVALRAGEMGIRRALGARGGEVVRMVLRQSLALTTLGVLVGLSGAFVGTRALGSFLHGVSPTDPLTYLFVAVGVCLVAVFAALVPARRAAGMDPATVLRGD